MRRRYERKEKPCVVFKRKETEEGGLAFKKTKKHVSERDRDCVKPLPFFFAHIRDTTLTQGGKSRRRWSQGRTKTPTLKQPHVLANFLQNTHYPWDLDILPFVHPRTPRPCSLFTQEKPIFLLLSSSTTSFHKPMHPVHISKPPSIRSTCPGGLPIRKTFFVKPHTPCMSHAWTT